MCKMGAFFAISSFYLLLFQVSYSLGGVPLEDFFPYGKSNHDSEAERGDDSFSEFYLTSGSPGFPFFNNTYNKLFVNINGAVSFRKGISQFTPDCAPMGPDFAMISPYWSDVELFRNGIDNVYFRQSVNQSDLSKAESIIRSVYTTMWDLELKWVFIATWNNVTRYNRMPLCYLTPRNTFQAALATDGRRSWAIFNYHKLQWTTGLASEGNCRGLGGRQAKAGFDTGDGVTFHKIRGSCTEDVLKLQEESNTNMSGRWIFKVDNYFDDVSAKCKDEGAEEILKFTPNFVSDWDTVKVKGPCLTNSTVFGKIEFWNEKRNEKSPVFILHHDSLLIDVKNSSFYIVMPDKVPPVGRLLVKVNITNALNKTVEYKGYVYTTRPKVGNVVAIPETTENGTFLLLKWDKSMFSFTQRIKASLIVEDGNQTRSVYVSEEFENDGSHKLQLFMKNLRLSEFDHVPRVSVVFTSSLKEQDGTTRVRRDVTGYIRDQWMNSDLGKSARLGVAKLSCFQNLWDKNIEPSSARDLASERCQQFHNNDPGLPVDSEGLDPCPPTKDLAESDHRFKEDKSITFIDHSYFHEGMGSSFRQVNTPKGIGNQCVYNKRGGIMCDGPGRGTVDAGVGDSLWDWIKWPFGYSKPAHFGKDVQPWCDCCKFSNNCEKYMDKRPCDDGTRWKPPRVARSTGDPHLTTFDGLGYMFNGVGEYWLVYSPEFKAQVRFISIGQASISTAFVFELGPTRVQIEGDCFLLLDGLVVDFPQEYGTELVTENVTIARDPSGWCHKIVISNGISFTFSRSGPSFNMMAQGHFRKNGKFMGLLGKFDDDRENEFTSRNGTVVPINATTRQIHYDFGLTWLVLENETIFTYATGKNYRTYYNPNFEPYFEVDMSRVTDQARTLCGNSSACLFDFVATGDLDFANGTRTADLQFNELHDTFKELQEAIEERTRLASILELDETEMRDIPVGINISLSNLPNTDRTAGKELQRLRHPDVKFRLFLMDFSCPQKYQLIVDSGELKLTVWNNPSPKITFDKWFPIPYFHGAPMDHRQMLKIEFWDVDPDKDEFLCRTEMDLNELFSCSSNSCPQTDSTTVIRNHHDTCLSGNVTVTLSFRGGNDNEGSSWMDKYMKKLEEFMEIGSNCDVNNEGNNDLKHATETESDHNMAVVTVSGSEPKEIELPENITVAPPILDNANEQNTKTHSHPFIPVHFHISVKNLPQNDEAFIPLMLWPDPFLKIFVKGYHQLSKKDGKITIGPFNNTYVFVEKTQRFFDKQEAAWELKRMIPYFLNETEGKQILNIEVWDEDIQFHDKMYDVDVDLDALLSSPNGNVNFTMENPAVLLNNWCCGGAELKILAHTWEVKDRNFTAGFP